MTIDGRSSPDFRDAVRASLRMEKARNKHGQVPGGADFADGLAELLAHPICRIDETTKAILGEVVDELRRDAAPHKKNRTGSGYSKARGRRSYAPILVGTVRNPDDLESYAWLRVVAFECALPGRALVRGRSTSVHPRPSAVLADVLRRILYWPRGYYGDDVDETIVRLGEKISATGFANGRDAQLKIGPFLGVREDLEGAEIGSALEAAVQYVNGRFARTASVPNRKPLLNPRGTYTSPEAYRDLVRADSEAPPPDDFFDEPRIVHSPTTKDVAADEGDEEAEVADRSEDPPPKAGEEQKLASLQADARQRYRLFLSGTLQPEEQRTLTPPDYRVSVEFILTKDQELEAAPHRRRAPWLILLISALTSRHYREVQDKLLDFVRGRPDRDGVFWIEADGFGTRVPIDYDLERKYQPMLPAIVLPWPTTVAPLLEHLLTGAVAWSEVLSADLTSDIHDASQDIRHWACKRFTLVRLRNSLAPAMYVGTGDTCFAQIVAGDALAHSSGPLHYYSNLYGRMRRAYAWSLAGWLPRHWTWYVSKSADDDERFGMPRSCLDDEAVRQAIGELRIRGDQPPAPRAETEQLCEHHNRFLAFVVALFTATTTHRLTEHLAGLTLRHMVLRFGALPDATARAQGPKWFGIVTFLDKFTVNALSSRAAVLAPMAVAQIEIFLAHLARMIDRLERHPARNREAIQALRKALDGEGPLFVFLKHDPATRGRTAARPFTSSDLTQLWPEWTYPGYVLRHRFAAFHWRHGLNHDDVLRQMGHSMGGIAFDESDPDSVLRFAERVAGRIEVALEGEGWGVVRSWMPMRVVVPDMAADSCKAIVGQHRALLNRHAELQKDATRRAIGKFTIVESASAVVRSGSRSTILDAARARVRVGLQQWLEDPAQQTLIQSRSMSPEDIERLTRSIVESLPSREYLVPALNLLRNRLQRMRSEDKEPRPWVFDLPPPVSVMRIAPPAITPASARAYLYCAEVLKRCDRRVCVIGAGNRPDWQEWLAITAVQIAIRNGVVSEARLLDVLSNAASLRRHPMLRDTVLVPVETQAVTTETRSDPGEESDATEQSAGEYVTVQGLPAICLLRWRALGAGRTREVLRQTLDRSIQALLPGPAQAADAGSSMLGDFLQCAQLARRLTVPGCRAAWEARSLPSKVLSVERQLDAWRSIVRRQDDEENIDRGTDEEISESASSVTADILRAVRLLLNVSEQESGQPRAPKTVASEIETKLGRWPEVPLTAKWVVTYVLYRLRAMTEREHRATFYQDFTTFLEPFLAKIEDSELSQMSSSEQTELFEDLLAKKVVNGPRVLPICRGIIREMAADGFEGPDLAVLERAAGVERKVGPAYIASPAERRWIGAQLEAWMHAALEGSLKGAIGAFEIEVARHIWELFYWLGLRTSEAIHLRHAELAWIDGEWILQIRRVRRRGTKNNSSIRPLRLRHFLPTAVLEAFTDFVFRQQSAAGIDETRGLFAPPTGAGRIANKRKVAGLLSKAMRMVLPRGEGRPYAGRHVRSSYGFQSILPEEHRSLAWNRDDAPLIPKYIAHLPLHFLVRFLSRSLGHASVRSSLLFYGHSLADLRGLGRGWTDPTLEVVAFAAGMPPATFNSKASRAGIGSADRESISALAIASFELDETADAAEAPSLESLPSAKTQEARLADLVPWIREWMRGERLTTLQHRFGISVIRLRAVARAIEQIDDRYRANTLDRTVALDGVDGKHLKAAVHQAGRRGPRRESLLTLAQGFDQMQHRSPDLWAAYLDVLEDQRDGFDRLDLANAPGSLRQALTSLIERIGLDVDKIALEDGVLRPVAQRGEGREWGRSAELALLNVIILARKKVAGAGYTPRNY